jgi:para-nitrobenzyl esterase
MGMGVLGPAIDGLTLPKTPRQANADGDSADIPLLIGTNRDEMKLFNVTPNRKMPADPELLERVGQLLNCSSDAAGQTVATIRRSRTAQQLTADNNDVLDTIASIAQFRNPAADFALAHAQHQPKTFHYLFTHESPARRGAYGACHALEMPFVFGTLNAPTQDRFAGTGPDVERLSANMMGAWLAFARSGDPSHAGVGTWPAYNGATRPTMIFDSDSRVADDPLPEERCAVAEALSN